MQGQKEVQLVGNVVGIEYEVDGRNPLQTLRCGKAILYIEGNELAPTLTMEFHNPTWQRANGSEGLAGRQVVRGLVLPASVKNQYESSDPLETLSPQAVSAALDNGPSNNLRQLLDRLQYRIDSTLAEITAEVHTRLVFGIGCVVLIMIGIALGTDM